MTDYFCVYLVILTLFFPPVYADSHQPEKFLKSIAGTKNEGKQIYTHFCINCHAQKPLISLGAPRAGEEGDWKPRLQQGFDALFKHTDEGLNAMPPRGGCFECTDNQLMLSILEMVPNSSKKELLNKLRDHKKSK